MAVSKRTAHEFLEAMADKNVEALIEACKKVSIECEEIWCHIDYHNKDKIYAPRKLIDELDSCMLEFLPPQLREIIQNESTEQPKEV